MPDAPVSHPTASQSDTEALKTMRAMLGEMDDEDDEKAGATTTSTTTTTTKKNRKKG